MEDAAIGSALLVPLRSNAHGLLAGSPVASVRSRLKAASLYLDSVVLETGVLRVSAGSGGYWSVVEHGDRTAAFQTSRERGQAQANGFVVSIGPERLPGVPAQTLDPFLQSDAAISWAATLQPFLKELPSDCDWVKTCITKDPDGSHGHRVNSWSKADLSNPALTSALPVDFVRDLVVKHSNRDLMIAVVSGHALTQDSLHSRVVAQRFATEASMRYAGFAIPILFPNVTGMTWEAIQDLRRDKHMARFRHVMREVEAQALEQAIGGDVEAAAHRAYQAVLARAAGQLESVATLARRVPISLVLGSATGIATMGIAGPISVAAGAGLGAAADFVSGGVSMVRARSNRGWLAVHQRLCSQ